MGKLLLIQDLEMDLDNLSRRLIKRGFTVQIESEVEAALKAARSQPVRLILLDMNLSDMDGWEAARRLREDESTRNAPILAMANDEIPGAEAMALDAGCADFEHRPVDFNRLVEKIQQLLAASPAG